MISGTGGITQQGSGTLILSGTNTYTGSTNVLAGTLAIAGSISTGLTTIHSGATLSGTGVVFGPVVVQGGGLLTSGINGSTGDFSIPNTVTVQPNGTINVAPGLFSIRALVLGAPTFINSTNSPTAAGTLFAGPVDPSMGLDLSNTSITIDFQPGSYPSTPTIYAIFVSPVAFAEKFGSITVNGGPGFALYTPREFSNALVVPFNVPTGISIGNLLVGSTNFTSFILFDPCAGLVVLSLIPESNIASALAAFIANQCSLSASSLGQLATVINKKVSNQGGGKTGSLLAAPLALLEQEKNNFQHSKMPAPLPPAEYFLLAENVEEDDPVGSPKRLPWLPPLEPWFPKISLSMNLLGQFQSQNAIDTPFVAFPAYLTKTAGVILGLDYIGFKSLLLGGAVTYAYTDLQVAANGGSQATQSFFGTVYSGLIFGNWAMNFVVTGSYNYNRLIRNIAEQPPTTVTLVDESVFGFEETFLFQLPGIPAGAAHAKYDSYQVTPHFDLNYEIGLGSISILPFILSDTIITFEDRITETGAPPVIPSACGGATTLNTVIQTVVSYMLQNEVGINLLEQVDLVEKGILIFRQKASYVNRYILPYSLKANFVDSPAPFVSIPIRFPIQHFCGATVESIYRRKLFSFILTYEGMYGSGYIFNAGFVRFARDF